MILFSAVDIIAEVARGRLDIQTATTLTNAGLVAASTTADIHAALHSLANLDRVDSARTLTEI